MNFNNNCGRAISCNGEELKIDRYGPVRAVVHRLHFTYSKEKKGNTLNLVKHLMGAGAKHELQS